MNDFGRLLVVLGLAMAAMGACLLAFGGRLPLGRLPGDIVIRRENMTLWLPIATSLLLSLILTLILWVLAWWRGRA